MANAGNEDIGRAFNVQWSSVWFRQGFRPFLNAQQCRELCWRVGTALRATLWPMGMLHVPALPDRETCQLLIPKK